MKYEVRLQRHQTVVAKSPESGVEFTVKDGKFSHNSVAAHVLTLNGCCLEIAFIDCLSDIAFKMITSEPTLSLVYVDAGHFCPAIGQAVKTMLKGEKALLTVKPRCKCAVY